MLHHINLRATARALSSIERFFALQKFARYSLPPSSPPSEVRRQVLEYLQEACAAALETARREASAESDKKFLSALAVDLSEARQHLEGLLEYQGADVRHHPTRNQHVRALLSILNYGGIADSTHGIIARIPLLLRYQEQLETDAPRATAPYIAPAIGTSLAIESNPKARVPDVVGAVELAAEYPTYVSIGKSHRREVGQEPRLAGFERLVLLGSDGSLGDLNDLIAVNGVRLSEPIGGRVDRGVEPKLSYTLSTLIVAGDSALLLCPDGEAVTRVEDSHGRPLRFERSRYTPLTVMDRSQYTNDEMTTRIYTSPCTPYRMHPRDKFKINTIMPRPVLPWPAALRELFNSPGFLNLPDRERFEKVISAFANSAPFYLLGKNVADLTKQIDRNKIPFFNGYGGGSCFTLNAQLALAFRTANLVAWLKSGCTENSQSTDLLYPFHSVAEAIVGEEPMVADATKLACRSLSPSDAALTVEFVESAARRRRSFIVNWISNERPKRSSRFWRTVGELRAYGSSARSSR